MPATQKKRSSNSSSKRSSSTKSRSSGSSKSSRGRSNSNGRSAEQGELYRRAAEDALQQLDWAIGYLHGIRKTDISKALAKNRSYIRRRLMGEAEEPVPSEQTEET